MATSRDDITDEYTEEEVEMYVKLQSFVLDYDTASEEEEKVVLTFEEEERKIRAEGVDNLKPKTYETFLTLPYNVLWKYSLHATVLVHCAFVLSVFSLGTLIREEQRNETLTILFYFNILDAIYFIDFILMFSYKLKRSLNIIRSFELKPWWQLTFDIISLIPMEDIYEFTIGGAVNWKIYEKIILRRLLRQYFLLVYVGKSRSGIQYQNMTFRVWQFIAMFVASSHFLLALLMRASGCPFTTMEGCNDTWTFYFVQNTNRSGGPKHIELQKMSDWYYLGLYVVLSKLTTNGLGCEMESKTAYEYYIYIVITFCGIAMLTLIVFTPITLVIVFDKQVIFEYAHIMKVMLSYLKEQKVDPKIIHKVKKFHEVFWVKSRGMKGLNTPDWLLVPVAKRVVCLDVYWRAYKHSQMFRDIDLPFLRYLSQFFTTEYYMPGDIIYKTFDLKSKMIYVVGGVIQILSEEDDETPIISFTTGTIIGEITLTLSYPSTTVLKSATYTELYILERSAYCSEMRNYPNHLRKIFRNVLKRFEIARELLTITETIQTPINVRQETTLAWIKKSLRDFQWEAQNERKLFKEKREKRRELENDFSIYNEIQHKAIYLELYNITEQTSEYDLQRVCLTGTFPWILKPESPFLKVWDRIILFDILVTTIIIPYNAVFSVDMTISVVVLILSTLYVFDIYIQMTTAIITSDGLVMNMKTLLYLKFMNVLFLLDFIGSFPFELAIYFLNEKGDISATFAILQCNRIIRIWKFEQFFSTLENALHSEVRYLRIFKYTFYVILAVYFYACLLFYETCPTPVDCYPAGWEIKWLKIVNETDVAFGHAFYFSASILTGLGIRSVQPTTVGDVIYVIIGYMISTVIFFSIVSGNIANSILSRRHWYIYQEMTQRLKTFITYRKLDKELDKRLDKFLIHEWQHNKGVNLIQSGVVAALPKYLHDEVRIDMCVKFLRKVTLFKELSDEFINKLATYCSVRLIPEEELVVFAGSVTYELYIIQDGYCEMISSLHSSLNKIIGSGSYFGEMEMCLEMPITTTVRTITICKIITLSSINYKKVASYYAAIKVEFSQLTAEIQAIRERARRKIAVQYIELSKLNVQTKKQSFFNFGYKLLRNTPEGHDYFRPFDKLRIFSFIRFILLRITIYPDGLFIKCWEISRSIFAFLSCMIYPTVTLYEVSMIPWMVHVARILDVTAYLDLYVRLHICYYTHDGLLIYHPLKTASYYVKHAFTLDFLGCFPVELFFASKTIAENDLRSFIMMFRLLQAHRIIHGIFYKANDSNTSLAFNLFKFIPVVAIVVNTIASVLIKFDCSFHHSIPEHRPFQHGVKCENFSWLMHSDYVLRATKNMRPAEVYALGVYFATSLMTRTGLPGIAPSAYRDGILVTILSIMGLMFMVVLYSALACSRSTKSLDLTYYQESMESLNKFMNQRKLSADIREEIRNYFQALWKFWRGIDPHQILKPCHNSLKNDVLYSLYGRALDEKSIFSGTSKSFFFNFLNVAHAEFYIEKSHICHVNEISSRLFVLVRGKVDIIGAQGIRLAALTPGALFGNLRNVKRLRLTVTAKSRSHVEILWIETKDFYHFLTYYSQMRKKFELLTSRYVDFVPAISSELVPSEESITERTEGQDSDMQDSDRYTASGIIIYPNNLAYRIWEYVAIVIGPIITYILVVYQICIGYYAIDMLAVGILFDIFYLVRPLIKLNLAYPNEVGEFIRNKRSIRRKYLRSIFGFAMDVITIPPIEVFAFLFPPKNLFYYMALFRLNRIPRILLMFVFFEKRKQNLNVSVYYMWLTNIVIWATMTIHTLACIRVVMSCSYKKCQVFGEEFRDKHLLYLKMVHDIYQIAASTTFATHITQDFTLIYFFICVAILGQIATGYIIGEVCTILEMATFSLSEYIRGIKQMRTSVQRNNLSPPLVKLIWSHVCNLWAYQRGRHYPEVLKLAPDYLKQKMNLHLYGRHLIECPVFFECDMDLLRQIALQMRELTFFPGTVIVMKGDIDNNIYFIHKGVVEILSHGEYIDRSVGILTEGAVFGLAQGLQSRKPHDCTYRARTLCFIVVLTKQKWEYLLDFFPASKEYILKQSEKYI